MNRKGLGAILLASCMIGIFGCSEHSPSGPNDVTTLNPESGRFGLSSMGKLEKRIATAAVQAGTNVKFNLGKIKGSSGFFFLLYNVGMTPITSVSLSVNNPAFSVFPSTMDTLIPGSDVGMLPVVKIAAFHGTPYDGVGSRPLLPMGQNKFTLHLSGNSKTASGADTVITLDAEMDLEALIMDLSIEGMAGPLGMSKIIDDVNLGPDINLVNELKIASYCMTSCKNDTNILIRNTGNVPLHCTVYRDQFTGTTDKHMVDTISDTLIKVGGNLSLLISSENRDVEPSDLYYVVASGDNAVADPSKLPLNDNGKFFALITTSPTNCSDAAVITRYNAYLATHQKDNCAKIWTLVDYRMMVYGQNYNNGDSIVFILYDFINNQLLSSFSGTKTALVQDDCYKGDYSADFFIVINEMLLLNNNKYKAFGLDMARVSNGGLSNWVPLTGFSLKPCNSSGQKN
jgi:hypothetical protein